MLRPVDVELVPTRHDPHRRERILDEAEMDIVLTQQIHDEVVAGYLEPNIGGRGNGHKKEKEQPGTLRVVARNQREQVYPSLTFGR